MRYGPSGDWPTSWTRGKSKGEIASHGGDRKSDIKVRNADLDAPLIDIAEQPDRPATLEEIGVTKQRLSEARTIRDSYTDDDIEEIVEEANAVDELVARTDFVKKKAHVSNNSGQNEWYTPTDYIEAARAVFAADFGIDPDKGEPAIELNPASSDIAQQSVMAATYHTKEDDGLTQDWAGRVWMNPPYAQPLIGQFIDKLVESYAKGDVSAAIVLVNNGTETKWGQTLLAEASHVCFPRGRIRFMDPEGNPGGAPLQGQMIAYLGPRRLWQERRAMGYDEELFAYEAPGEQDRSLGFRQEFAKFGVVFGG